MRMLRVSRMQRFLIHTIDFDRNGQNSSAQENFYKTAPIPFPTIYDEDAELEQGNDAFNARK